MAVRKQILQLITNNRVLAAYLFFMLLIPILCSSYIVYLMRENYFFFQGLQWLDVSIIFCFLSFTMAFGLTPTTFICFLSGFIWGWQAIFFIIPSYLIAQLLGFQIARFIDGEKLINYLKAMNKMPGFLTKLKENEQQIIFFCRLSPVLPFALMNIVLSVFKVNFKQFMIFGFLGMMPRTMLVIWLGSQSKSLLKGLHEDFLYNIIFIILTIGSIVGIGRVFKIKLGKG